MGLESGGVIAELIRHVRRSCSVDSSLPSFHFDNTIASLLDEMTSGLG